MPDPARSMASYNDDDDDDDGAGNFTCQAGWSMASPGFHQDGL